MDIEKYLDNGLTLRALSDKLIEQSQQRPRNYLGFSEIAEPCWRMLFYRFRNVLLEPLQLNSILAIEDGYRQESIMADRLRLLEFIKLDTVNPETGGQFAFSMLGGHFRGHADGKIAGILEAPKTQHVWENKACGVKKFNQFKKLTAGHEEKKVLELFDQTYYGQAVMYMEASGLKRHYTTVELSGGRDYASCRTDENPKLALSLKAKAESIILADRPPARLSENRSYYLCSWCNCKEVCFDNKVPQVNCRTCAFSEPMTDGADASWHCYKKNINFTSEGEKECTLHLFLNTLAPFRAIDAEKSDNPPNWIKYSTPEDDTFYNINSEAKTIPNTICLTSQQIYDLEYFECIFPNAKNKNLANASNEKEEKKKLKNII